MNPQWAMDPGQVSVFFFFKKTFIHSYFLIFFIQIVLFGLSVVCLLVSLSACLPACPSVCLSVCLACGSVSGW